MKHSVLIAALLLFGALPGVAEKKPQQPIKPMAGPRATALRVTWLYVGPDTTSQKVDRVQPGRELVVAERSGPWLRVFANTDALEIREKDQPWFGSDESTPPLSGWVEAKGIVVEGTKDGDLILMGEGAIEEAEAQDPRGAANAATSARLLYKRLVEIFPDSQFVPEARWRAADIRWQSQKADAATRPSSREREAYLRDQMDEDELKKLIKDLPKSRQADLAAYELIENKLCGDWQGLAKCPEKESEYYEKYAAEHPGGARTAQALYQAVYRLAALVDIYLGDEHRDKADAARRHAAEVAAHLKDQFPTSDWSARAAALVFKLNEGVPVYGIDRE